MCPYYAACPRYRLTPSKPVKPQRAACVSTLPLLCTIISPTRSTSFGHVIRFIYLPFKVLLEMFQLNMAVFSNSVGRLLLSIAVEAKLHHCCSPTFSHAHAHNKVLIYHTIIGAYSCQKMFCLYLEQRFSELMQQQHYIFFIQPHQSSSLLVNYESSFRC